jgi:hypothetical protein
MGERKTPQELRCGNAEEGTLSNHCFYGRKGIVLRSHSFELGWNGGTHYSSVLKNLAGALHTDGVECMLSAVMQPYERSSTNHAECDGGSPRQA